MTKYRAQKTIVDGITFASKREAARYQELKLLERAGEIRLLTLQPRYNLYCGDQPIMMTSKAYPNGRHATYVADFRYFEKTGIDPDIGALYRMVVEDSKGMATPVYKLKKAIMKACHGIEIREV